jgi:hypothetical protein
VICLYECPSHISEGKWLPGGAAIPYIFNVSIRKIENPFFLIFAVWGGGGPFLQGEAIEKWRIVNWSTGRIMDCNEAIMEFIKINLTRSMYR